MDRVVHKAKSFKEADDWDARQYLEMTPAERVEIAIQLKKRAYPGVHKDIRECHREEQ